jgi:hypothetical protein
MYHYKPIFTHGAVALQLWNYSRFGHQVAHWNEVYLLPLDIVPI